MKTKLFSVEEHVVLQDRGDEYLSVTQAALEKYPDDYSGQLKYVKENGTEQYYAMWLVDRAQYVASRNPGKTIEISSVLLDYIFRSFKDSLRHMKPGLAQGVYRFINRMDGCVAEMIEKLTK